MSELMFDLLKMLVEFILYNFNRIERFHNLLILLFVVLSAFVCVVDSKDPDNILNNLICVGLSLGLFLICVIQTQEIG